MMWYYKAQIVLNGVKEKREGVVPADYVTDAMDEVEDMACVWGATLIAVEIFSVNHGHMNLVMSSYNHNREVKLVQPKVSTVTRVTTPTKKEVQPFTFGAYWKPQTYAVMTLKEN